MCGPGGNPNLGGNTCHERALLEVAVGAEKIRS